MLDTDTSSLDALGLKHDKQDHVEAHASTDSCGPRNEAASMNGVSATLAEEEDQNGRSLRTTDQNQPETQGESGYSRGKPRRSRSRDSNGKHNSAHEHSPGSHERGGARYRSYSREAQRRPQRRSSRSVDHSQRKSTSRHRTSSHDDRRGYRHSRPSQRSYGRSRSSSRGAEGVANRRRRDLSSIEKRPGGSAAERESHRFGSRDRSSGSRPHARSSRGRSSSERYRKRRSSSTRRGSSRRDVLHEGSARRSSPERPGQKRSTHDRSESSRRLRKRRTLSEDDMAHSTASPVGVASSERASSGTVDESATKRKRRTGWDSAPSMLPPVDPALLTGLGIGSLVAPTSTGFTASLAGKTPEEIQAELAERQAQAASVAASMQLKATASQLCRIYVGSLDYSLTDNDVRQVFSAFGPITNIDMPKEGTRSKGFCFVEYATPESADMAIATMPGFNLKGRAIKVGRPTALGGQSSAVPSMFASVKPAAAGVNAAEAGQIAAAMLLARADGSSGLSQSPSQNRVYVGSVPYSFTNNDIKQIFDVFGTIISCQLIPSNERPGTHRGYGFIEYSKFEEAKLAIETMNDFPVAGKILKVNYATAMRGGLGSMFPPSVSSSMDSGNTFLAATGANAVPVLNHFTSSSTPAAAFGFPAASAGAVVTPSTTVSPSTIASPAVTSPSSVTATVPGFPSVAPPTAFQTSCSQSPVLLLCNMVDIHEANDELKEEIQQECTKYGPIEAIEIAVDSTTSAVRIFVVFEKPESAASAVPALHDRWFGGRKISARQYDASSFHAHNLWL